MWNGFAFSTSHRLLLAAVLLPAAACGSSDTLAGIVDALDDDLSSGDVGQDPDATAPDVEDAADAAGDAADDADADAPDAAEVSLPDECDDDLDCLGLVCWTPVAGDPTGICVAPCADDAQCGRDEVCQLVSGAGGDAQRVCVPEGLCIDGDGDGFGFGAGCRGPDCDETDDAVYLGATERCDGVDNDCDDRVDDDVVGLGLPCESGFPGECAAGVVACRDGIEVCEAIAAPVPERCDGLDNDCDGAIDEGEAAGSALVRACYAGPAATRDVGLCRAGVETCADGSWGTCTDQVVPATESCNGFDDDCDGEVDEGAPGAGLVCVSGLEGECSLGVTACVDGTAICEPTTTGRPEICDGVDNDCDGAVDQGDPGGGAACATGLLGACGTGRTSCVAGALQCAAVTEPGDEVCDGVDNDCNGVVDDGDPRDGEACDSGEPGICGAGALACLDGGLVCVASTSGRAETCNGLDDNCDEAIDNAPIDAGGACSTGSPGVCAAGTLVCEAGGLVCRSVVAPSPEVCDGLDNDCVGGIDDGNPGGGGACSTGLAGVCAAGRIDCAGGRLTCTQLAPPSSEVCDGLDNNCAGGVDEGNPGGGLACSTGRPGVCAAGTTRCSGGSVTCEQNVAASGEVCDGLDNNCAGGVDDGCPTGLTLSAGATSPSFGGTGGIAYTTNCAAGSAMVGFTVRSGGEVDAVGARCAPLGLNQSTATTPYTYTVATGAVSNLTQYGGSGGTAASAACPTGQVVIGVNVRADARLDRLQWVCGTLSVAGNPGSLRVERSTQGSSATYGGTGGTASSFTCPDSQIATGISVRTGSRVDSLTLRCSVPGLTVR